MVATGFRFSALMDRDARRRGTAFPAADRRPAAAADHDDQPPARAGDGHAREVVVHGEDIRRPAGLPGAVAADAANACLEMYTSASFPVGGKKRIRGLRLVATDTGWSYGAGPQVSGPALSLLLAMTGRAPGLDELSGDGAAVLGQRLTAPAG